MKELYYTKNTIADQSRIFKKKTDQYYKQKEWKIDPDNAVLLILDMQNFFLSKNSHAFVPSAEAIIPQITKLSTTLSDLGSDTIYTRHINTEENSKNMGKWWRDILLETDKLSELNKNVYIGKSPIIFKSQYDAFFNTDLEKRLINLNKSQVIISGVMTHLCCETTARSAFVRGFEVFFGIDLTATYNKELHLSTLLTLSHGFAVPVLYDEIIMNINEDR